MSLRRTTSKLIVLYGPPAVGKTTVGSALAAAKNSILFTNTASKAFVGQFISADSTIYVDTIDSLRYLMIGSMLAAKKEIIFTFVYTGTTGDRSFLKNLESIARDHAADINFVRLVCDKDTLLSRIENQSRRIKGKLADRKTLELNMATHNYYARYPFPGTVVINTDLVQPADAVTILNDALFRRGA